MKPPTSHAGQCSVTVLSFFLNCDWNHKSCHLYYIPVLSYWELLWVNSNFMSQEKHMCITWCGANEASGQVCPRQLLLQDGHNLLVKVLHGHGGDIPQLLQNLVSSLWGPSGVHVAQHAVNLIYHLMKHTHSKSIKKTRKHTTDMTDKRLKGHWALCWPGWRSAASFFWEELKSSTICPLLNPIFYRKKTSFKDHTDICNKAHWAVRCTVHSIRRDKDGRLWKIDIALNISVFNGRTEHICLRLAS